MTGSDVWDMFRDDADELETVTMAVMGSDAILLEDGDYILQETGDKILLQSA